MAARLNININSETEQALEELAGRKETTVTEIVRRAVSVYNFLDAEMAAGKRLQVVEGDAVTALTFV